VAVSCPGTSECVAVDSAGARATFDPRAPAVASTATIDSQQPTALQCLGATYCAVLDTAGRSVEFDPHASGSTVARRIGSSASLAGFGCVAPATCVAVDTTGYAFAGSAVLPALPSSLAPPRISGTPQALARLTSSGGAWSGSPTSIASQWQRCASNGSRCADIPGAGGSSYTLTRADVGHVLRVRAAAANQAGYGAARNSALTRTVASAPAAPKLRATLSAPRGNQPRVLLSLKSAGSGPALKVLTISLPVGVSFARRPGSIQASSSGRRLPVSARLVHGGLVLSLGRAVNQLQVVLRAPGLRLRSSLQRALARRRPPTLWLAVALPARPRPLRSRVQLVVKS
jgi:hypothetical protein